MYDLAVELNWRQEVGDGLSVVGISELLRGADVSVVSAERIQEGLANENYRVVGADGLPYLFRRFVRDPAALALEVAISRRLSGVVPVPHVSFFDLEAGVSLSEWRPGVTLQRVLASGTPEDALAVAPELGEILGQISAVKFPEAGLLDASLEVASAWPSV